MAVFMASLPAVRNAIGKSAGEGQTAGLSQEKGDHQAPLDEQCQWPTPRSPCAAGDQPGGQPDDRRPPTRPHHLRGSSVASMRFKARSMNAYLYASNLAHIPKQIAGPSQRGMAAHAVKPRTPRRSAPLPLCDRANRPAQQTFLCRVCGYRDHADCNASQNLPAGLGTTNWQRARARRR